MESHGREAEVVRKGGGRGADVEVPSHPLLGELEALVVAGAVGASPATAAGKRRRHEGLGGVDGRRRQVVRSLDLAACAAVEFLELRKHVVLRGAEPAGPAGEAVAEGRRIRPDPHQVGAGGGWLILPAIGHIGTRDDDRAAMGGVSAVGREKNRPAREDDHACPAVVEAEGDRVAAVEAAAPAHVEEAAGRLASRQPVGRSRCREVEFAGGGHVAFPTTLELLLNEFSSAADGRRL